MQKTKTVDLGKKGSFTSHPGRLHRELGVKEGKKIPMEKKHAALHSKNPQTRRDARAAIGYAHMNHNGPKAHMGKDGLHYGAHEGHEAICSQKGSDCK